MINAMIDYATTSGGSIPNPYGDIPTARRDPSMGREMVRRTIDLLISKIDDPNIIGFYKNTENLPKRRPSYSWTSSRLAYFFGSIDAESAMGTNMRELSPSPILGNYYGRGFVMISTSGGYSDMADMMKDPEIYTNPDILATDLNLSARVALRRMIIGGVKSLQDINSAADFISARVILQPLTGPQEAQNVAITAMGYLNIFQHFCGVVQLPGNATCQ